MNKVKKEERQKIYQAAEALAAKGYDQHGIYLLLVDRYDISLERALHAAARAVRRRPVPIANSL